MPSEINGLGLAAASIGAVFVYGGLKGKSPLATLQSVIRGQDPRQAAQSAPIGTVNYQDVPPALRTGAGGGAVVGQVETFLRTNLGMSKAGAAGWMGNFQWESSMSTTTGNPAEGAIGLAQWEGGRRTALDRYAASHGLKETDLQAQLGYLAHEIHGADAGAASAYLLTKGATDPSNAAITVDRLFERSDQKHHADRARLALQFFEGMK